MQQNPFMSTLLSCETSYARKHRESTNESPQPGESRSDQAPPHRRAVPHNSYADEEASPRRGNDKPAQGRATNGSAALGYGGSNMR
jgi:hypothetical protein